MHSGQLKPKASLRPHLVSSPSGFVRNWITPNWITPNWITLNWITLNWITLNWITPNWITSVLP
jgi:hypothetical protein